ncbi:hypothetical protein H702_07150 [Streptococcus equinus JB1]|uniref:Phage protein n=1 Tax=Streptococcus equinus JB1 TaxID=1294274 RepID=A0A091BU03_STREI|nr:DUF1642 domain-containing protein [Streptococcus equinus]KFN87247.1 hypothetical protein H702_07150 [Streptococcus equinus JB1]QBX15713.1 hypothetical protein Javan207_0027 [Streptococcus phage Javan207]SFL16052.1 Protein of unknown function [Streptococcus equinus JB1]
MNKQEAIEEIKNLEGLTILDKTINFDNEMIPKKEVLNIVNQINEPEKPTVPQYVADWYEEHKQNIEMYITNLCIDYVLHKECIDDKVADWYTYLDNKPIQTLVNMHQFGYGVEKEKLYTVELPNPNDAGHVVLYKDKNGKITIEWDCAEDWKRFEGVKLTESEIKKDFAWTWQFAEEVNDND